MNSKSFLRHGKIIDYPNELRGFLNCTVGDFQRGLLHTEIHTVETTSAYHFNTGMCVFYHKHMNRTCRMSFTSDHVQVSETLTGCITHLFDLTWDGDADFVNYLAILECKIKLKVVPWRHIIRDDAEFVAVPHSAIERMTTYIKQRLLALSVQFHYSVAIQNTSQRCLLIPSTLINTNALPFGLDTRLWNILTFYPTPVIHVQSPDVREVFGTPNDADVPLSDLLRRHHTTNECAQIQDTWYPLGWPWKTVGMLRLRQSRSVPERTTHTSSGCKHV